MQEKINVVNVNKSVNFRILAYNINGLYNKLYLEDFFQFINYFDLFFLFETHVDKVDCNDFDRYFEQYNLCWIPANKVFNRGRASNGCLFGIRKVFKNISFTRIIESIVVKCVLRDDIFYIIPTYLNSSNWTVNFDELANVLTELAQESIMVIGDLNGRISNTQIVTDVNLNSNFKAIRQSKDLVFNGNGKKLIDLFQMFDLFVLNGCSRKDNEGDFTFIGAPGKSVIDLCAITSGWFTHVVDLEVSPEIFSDHLPIVVHMNADVSLETRELNLLPKLRWRSDYKGEYHRKLSECISIIDINEGTTKCLENLQTCILASAPKFVSNNRKAKHEWFDVDCLRARKTSFRLLQLYRNSSNPILKSWYFEANKNYKSICAEKKRNFDRNLAVKLANTRDTKSFYALLRQINGNSFKFGITISTVELSIHFESLLRSRDDLRAFSFAHPLIKVEVLDISISMDELKKALMSAKNNKAPGNDRISNEFYKNANDDFLEILLRFYNKIFDTGDMPGDFRKSIIFPLHKKGPVNCVENYRGISFMNSIAKIFCGIVLKRLEKWVEENKLISDFQAGFRRNYSTHDQIFTIATIIKSFLSRKRKVYAFFIDFKAAFDSVNRDALLYKLSCIGISTKMLNIIRALYTNTESAVWDGQQISGWFRTTSGVKQGCPLSALLFALLIDDIVDILPGGVRLAELLIKALLYADDIVVFAETPHTLQLMMNRISEYSKRWSLEINASKSKVMVFRNNHGRFASGERWFYNGEEVEIVKEFKYLGVKLTPNMKFEKHLAEKRKAALSLINASWKKVIANKNVLLSTKYQVFCSVVRSSLCYAAQVWGCFRYEVLERAMRDFLKKVFNIPYNAPNYAIYLETGLPLLHNFTLKLHINYIMKILESNDDRLVRKVVLYEMRNKNFWAKEWISLGQKCGRNLMIDPNKTETLRNDILDIMQISDAIGRAEFEEEAKNSNSRILYSALNYNLCCLNYFKDEYSYKKISLLFKLRTETLFLNGCPYSSKENKFCTLCNLNAKEDCFHFLSICPVFGEIRLRYFRNKSLNMTQTIDVLNGSDWTTLYNYSKEALSYRLLIINEFF